MNFTLHFLLAVSLLVITAHRLPAPIQEVPESPTPSPTRLLQPNPPTTTPERADSARFAGTWKGKIKIGNTDFDITLVVNREATALTQESKRSGERVHQNARSTTVSGHTLWWRGGQSDNIGWTLTPNPDGQSALVTTKVGAGVENTATFQRAQAPAEPPPTPMRKHPGEKVKGDSGN